MNEFYIELIFWLLLIVFIYAIFRVLQAAPKAPEPKRIVEGTVVKEFNWTSFCNTKKCSFSLRMLLRENKITEARKELLEGTPNKTQMSGLDDYFQIAKKQVNHPEFGFPGNEVYQAADYILEYAQNELLSSYEVTQIALDFVHEESVMYSYDQDSTSFPEYFRFPLETLNDQTGDCDCKAILGCALFKALGYDVKFAIMPGHAALLLRIPGTQMAYANFQIGGEKWYYCETTGDNWSPGMLPDGISPADIRCKDV